ncbi:hypothetical protein QOZ80_4AG0325360 [Eleusine coracana subsp. coracana]|nr:hypothetical protein QOZ80_4AG0325360 [Eleusine coracana subsp. coracana]
MVCIRKRPRSLRASDAEQTALPASNKRRRDGTGGIYIPPHARAASDNNDVTSGDDAGHRQRRSWDALRRRITGLAAVPAAFTDVFAALASAVNARLLLARLVLRVRRAHAVGDRQQLAAAARFVAHDLLALELATVLLDNPTADSVEVAVGLVAECGAALSESCPRGVDAVFDCLRKILHDGDVEKRVQFMIEDLFAIRKSKFRDHPSVWPELDLVEPEDQVTHQVELSDQLNPEAHLDVFNLSLSFVQDEAASYEDIKRSILGDDGESSLDESSEEESEVDATIHDQTKTDLTSLRRTIYLTIMSSLGSEEAGHKLLSITRPGLEPELCAMIVECCTKEKTCTSYYAQLGQRLCAVDRAYQAGFEACFARHYAAAHLMQSDELRASVGFFARLLAADALPWRGTLGLVRVTEEDTTSSARIFLKVMFQDLTDQLGIRMLSRKMNNDSEVRDALVPRDSARNTRFAINFFTAIGLGGVTESARSLLVLSVQYKVYNCTAN